MRLSYCCYHSFKIINLGKVSYTEGLKQQKKYLDLVKRSRVEIESENFLIAVEHPPVYTVGIRSKFYSIEEEKRLKDIGADFHRTSRGGLITFHGPGQLVLYPIFDLRRISRKPIGVRRFVELLEQVIIDCASNDFNLCEVGRTQHTGVWVEKNRKLAALGIAVSHGVTYHGLAINCNIDLSWFEHVVGCGVEGAVATSLSKECNMNISLEDVLPLIVKSFTRNFECLVHC